MQSTSKRSVIGYDYTLNDKTLNKVNLVKDLEIYGKHDRMSTHEVVLIVKDTRRQTRTHIRETRNRNVSPAIAGFLRRT